MRLSTSLLFLLFSLALNAQYTSIPDANFEQALIDAGYDTNPTIDGKILTSEAEAVTSMYFSNKNISDLTGIEAFINLTNLICSNNQLTNLIMGTHPSLKEFNCSNNLLTHIDISNCVALVTLECYSNDLTSINTSNNPDLETIFTWSNLNLINLDVTQNPKMRNLQLHGCNISSIDVTQCPVLDYFFCDDNNISSLDLSQNLVLRQLGCSYNSTLSGLDLSANTNLRGLDMKKINMSSIDLTHNTKLDELRIDGNGFTTIDLSQNPKLKDFYCTNNDFVTINLQNNTELARLECENNKLINLDLSQNPVLKKLGCSKNAITTLDISNNPILEDVQCSMNDITKIIPAPNGDLDWLYCNNNAIDSLDLSLCPKFKRLHAEYNQLTFLDLRNGNNTSIAYYAFNTQYNPNLSCIFVDDSLYSQSNWNNIDANTHFVETKAGCEAAGCSIAQSEIDALLDLYNSTNGASWTSENDGDTSNDWDINNPIENWYGLTIDCDNQTATNLDLGENNLTGTIPISISDLSNMKFLFLDNNNLSGAIPSSIGYLSKLAFLHLEFNQLTGEVPSTFSLLTNISSIWVLSNELHGPFPDMTSSPINWIAIGYNAFQFEDFEDEFNYYSNGTFYYAPQADVDEEELRTLQVGESTTMEVHCTGSQNIYNWYKNNTLLSDGIDISGTQTSILTINNLKESDAGLYHCRVTSSICTDGGSPNVSYANLEIHRKNIDLQVTPAACSITQPELDALLDLYNSTNGANWISENDADPSNDWNINNPIEEWYGLTIGCDNQAVKGLALSSNNLEGTLPSSFVNLTNITDLNISNNKLSGAIPDFSNFNIGWCIINYNKFEFGDFENECQAYDNNFSVFWYSPQGMANQEETRDLVTGESTIMVVNCSGENNIYQWYKYSQPISDGGDISGAQSSQMTITNLKSSDAGSYHCRLTNSLCTNGGSPGSSFQNLEIRRKSIQLNIAPTACSIAQSEQDALVAFYNEMDGPNWTSENDGDTSNDWKITNPIENWFGLTIDCDNHTVTHLDLSHPSPNPSNNLSGTLPNSISNLPNLIALNLGFNNISGTLDSIMTLTHLISLKLLHNNFTGIIPNSITNLKDLVTFDVNTNNLSGDFPVSIMQLTKLKLLKVNFNKITGTIPDNIGDLDQLYMLQFGTNKMEGTIPSSLGTLSNLKYIGFQNNNFHGKIPDLSNQINPIYLSFEKNAFQFGDFEAEFNAYDNNFNYFSYAPQAPVNQAVTHNLAIGTNISFVTNCSGSQNHYQWYKDNIIIAGATNDTLNLTNLLITDTGKYFCKVTSDIVSGLTIERAPITLNISGIFQTPNVYNYADSVIAFSSEWSTSSWNHNEVLGHFNTYPCYGDISTSWASSSSGAEREFLELYFNNASPIDSIFIYETYNAGAVDTVYVKNPNNNTWEVVYTAIPTNITSSRILKIGFPTTTFNVSEVRIAIFSQGTSWNEIDAVAINSIPDETPDSATIDCNNSTISIGTTCGGPSIGDATFLWTTSNGNILSGGNTASANIDAPGLYTLSVTKNNDVVSYDILVNSDIDNIPPTTYNQTLCSGESLSVNGTTYNQSNPSGSETFTTPSGCDSIVNINLTFIDVTTTEYNQTLCSGESLTINGTIYNQSNSSGTETLTGISGCDSIVNIQLSFSNAITTDYTQTLCNGQDLTVNGTTYNQNNPSGTETMTANSGCDSIINVKLVFQDFIFTNINQTLCYEQSLTVNGTIYNRNHPTGKDTLTATSGCDSIININLAFIAPIYSIVNKTLCLGEEFILNGTTYDQNNPSGAETLTTVAGCDSLVNINLIFPDPIDTTIMQTLCPGEDLTINDIIYNQSNPSGSQILTAASGCDSTININLDFLTKLPEIQNDNFIIHTKEDTIIDIISNDSLPDDWTIEIINSSYPDYFNVNYEGNIDLYSHLAKKGDLLNITYQICDQACTELCSTGQIHINFNFLDQHKDVLVSDILTLNGDGKNDILFFKNLTYNNRGIQIFNRWGDLVFAENPYTNQWNGTNQSGANLPNATYYYILTINRSDRKIIKGDVLLVR